MASGVPKHVFETKKWHIAFKVNDISDFTLNVSLIHSTMTEEKKLVTNINIWNNHTFELSIIIELYEDHRSEGVST